MKSWSGWPPTRSSRRRSLKQPTMAPVCVYWMRWAARLWALRHPACTRLLGPFVPGQDDAVPGGARVPGTVLALDPIQAAFNTSTLIRWLDYNDTWLAAEWGHPSDNIGALLAVADYLCRGGQRRITMRELESLIIRAYEIQGVLAIDNSFNRVGFDHVLLVKLACACTVTALLSGDADAIVAAASQALVDAGPLRTYRHAPNTGSRKSWAAGDAAARGVQLAYLTMRGEPGYPRAVEAPRWGLDAGAAARATVALRAAGQPHRRARAVQGRLPRGVPRADRGRGGDRPASAGTRPAGRD